MEKDITILKSLIEDLKREEKLIGYNAEVEIQALENLIKGYKQLKIENEAYEEGKIFTDEQIKVIKENTIPKSKVKEKIEELESYKGLVMFKKYNYEVIINHLQELMEDK